MHPQSLKEKTADTIAAVGFLFASRIPENLAERLATPSDDLIERVERLVALRQSQRNYVRAVGG